MDIIEFINKARMQKVEKMSKQKDVEGFLSGIEWLCLYYLARQCEGKGDIVEIGTFVGKSTIELARGLRDNFAMEGKVVMTVDPHTGSEEHKVDGKDINTFPRFTDNIVRANVHKHIVPAVMTSVEASKLVEDCSIELIFIDGSHKYEDVEQDFLSWYPKLMVGGVMAFHDSNWEDVADVLNKYVVESGKFGDIFRVGSITYARKL